MSGLIVGLFQCTVNKTVLGVHNRCLAIAACLFLYTGRCLIALGCQVTEILYTLLTSHVVAQILQHLTIVLQELQ